MNFSEAADRLGNADPELRELLDDLHREWADLPASVDGFSDELLLTYLRQAYGAGYTRAAAERERAA